MKLLTSSLLLGASLAAAYGPGPEQIPLQDNTKIREQYAKIKSQPLEKLTGGVLEKLKHTAHEMTDDVRGAWEEVSRLFPESITQLGFPLPVKSHKRKPDSEWDHVVKGADIQSVWVENAKGEKEREIEGHLEPYTLRVKKNDPSKLGVDKVKQYSGYLDDEEEDKHLFYCKSRPRCVLAQVHSGS